MHVVTTEDDFQATLDADPSDWQTRLVFADWLEEHGDPRAAGYRALGMGLSVGGWDLWDNQPNSDGWTLWFTKLPFDWFGDTKLPFDWFGELSNDRCLLDGAQSDLNVSSWRDYYTRREGEDDISRAFAKLSAKRQAELLRQPVLA